MQVQETEAASGVVCSLFFQLDFGETDLREKIQWNKDEQSAWQLSVTFPSCFRDWIPGNSPLAQLIPLAPGDSLLHATRQWDDLFSLVLREMGKKSYGDFHQWGYTPIAGLFLYVFVRENPI